MGEWKFQNPHFGLTWWQLFKPKLATNRSRQVLSQSYRDTRQAGTLAAGESLKEVLRLQVDSVYGWSMVCLSWASLVLIQLQYLYLYVFTEMAIFSLKKSDLCSFAQLLDPRLTPRQQRTEQTQPWSKPKSWPSTRPADITTKSSWVYNVQ